MTTPRMRLIARIAEIRLMLEQGDDGWKKCAVLNGEAIPLAVYVQQLQAALESRNEKETARLLTAIV